MTAIQLTGMSGAGKSTTLEELARRGHEIVETDEGDWIEVVDGEPLWREDAIRELLARPRERILFVQGTVLNQGVFADRFAAVVLLTAPRAVLLERVASRTTNGFGKSPEQRALVEAAIDEVEPLLRRSATHVIDTTRPLGEVADELERIAGARR